MATRIGRYTLRLDTSPSVECYAAIGAKKEAEGPLAACFDQLMEDSTLGEQTWEKAESRLQKEIVALALNKGGLSPEEIDCIFAGDLLNQCTSSSYGLRSFGLPLIGVYGACSTMAESLGLAGLFVEGGFARRAMAVTSSHFCSAEKQFRFPLEYGGQRPPTSQWTVTGAGAAVAGPSGGPPYLRAVTFGRVQDMGIKDANNMGAAMAPAAADTFLRYFDDTRTAPEDYDMIFTGDLGQIGSDLLLQLTAPRGIDLAGKHTDCGLLIYDRKKQTEVGAGGSGCGCAATVLCGYLLDQLREGRFQEILFMATGALMSPTIVQQGESIPGVAHLLHLSANPWPKEVVS